MVLGHFPGIRARPPRWCPSCAGLALTELVAGGVVVTVTGLTTTGLAAASVHDTEVGVGGLEWSVERAVQVLRLAQPDGSTFLRALVDEGGHATAARLREITGFARLNPMTQTLNSAVRRVFDVRRLAFHDRHLARPGNDPDKPRAPSVHDYTLPAHLVPILDEALRQLGR